MRNELSHIEAIENYLNGKMSHSERVDFELKMNADFSFREDVELQESISDRVQFLAFKAEVISSHAGLVLDQKAWWKKGVFLNSILVLIGCLLATYVITVFLDKPISESKAVIEASPDPVQEESFLVNEVSESDSLQTTNELVVTTLKNSKSKKNKPHLAFQKPFEKSILNATTGGTIITKDSKSSIHFDPNSLVDQDGKLVEGIVEIRYREYRNSAEMAFSGIPMMYEENGNEYRFNSAGMIEVRAYQNDEALNIKPGADFTIDYNLTQQVDSCFFFALDDEKQKWEKNERIDFDSLNAANLKEAEARFEDKKKMGLKYRGMLQGRVDLVFRGDSRDGLPAVTINLYYPKNYYEDKKPAYQTSIKGVAQFAPAISKDSMAAKEVVENTGNAYALENIDSGRYVAEIRCEGCSNIIVDTLVIYGDKVSQLDATLSLLLEDNFKNWRRSLIFGKKKRQMKEQWKPSSYVLTDSIMPIDGWNYSARKRESDSLANVREGLNNETKSMLVEGLSCKGFGVYNCDQIQRVNDRINIRPKFVGANGIVIAGIYLLTMIDLNINAAFSFSPFDFKVERGGKTVVLAFTMDKFYAISADQFAALNIQSSGDYAIEMQDITDQIKTTDDLKKYLGI